jgi:hypothetical protein
MTKQETIDKLDELGIEYQEEATAKELKALLPDKTDDETFVVVDSAGTVKRTFTVADQGDDAEDLANQFAKKFGFKVQ